MKASSIDTHMGSIAIDTEAIAQYAGVVATECFGIVGMAGISMKDGLVKLLKKESMAKRKRSGPVNTETFGIFRTGIWSAN